MMALPTEDADEAANHQVAGSMVMVVVVEETAGEVVVTNRKPPSDGKVLAILVCAAMFIGAIVFLVESGVTIS